MDRILNLIELHLLIWYTKSRKNGISYHLDLADNIVAVLNSFLGRFEDQPGLGVSGLQLEVETSVRIRLDELEANSLSR
jgi:hypothetical protein